MTKAWVAPVTGRTAIGHQDREIATGKPAVAVLCVAITTVTLNGIRLRAACLSRTAHWH